MKYIKTKWRPSPFSRERAELSIPSEPTVHAVLVHARVRCLIVYDIHCIMLCYFCSYMVQYVFKKRRCARMRVHVTSPPPPGLSGPAHRITWHPLWPIATESGRRARRSGSRTPWLFLIGGADVRVPAESLCGGVEKRKYNNHGRRETQGEWRLKTKGLFMIS